MQDLADLAKAGLFMARDFLDPAACQRLMHEADESEMTEAGVTTFDAESVTDESRRTLRASVHGGKDLIDARVDQLVPDLVRHFGEPLSPLGSAQVLLYRPGDFFRPHIDSAGDRRLPEGVRKRRVSIVVFLNGQAASPRDGAFGGGSLMFFRLPTVGEPNRAWTELRPEQGLLVAFRSEIMHEVRPVTHGVRYSAVRWFGSPPGDP